MIKKSLLLTLLLAVFAPWAANAQETLTVHDGTGTNRYVPFYGYYADEAQTNQMIYPAAELGDMDGGTISGMTFYWTPGQYSGGSGVGTWTISIGETTATSLSGLDNTTAFTVVFTGGLDALFNSTDHILPIAFDSPYIYNGGNLIVQFSHQTVTSYKDYAFYGETVQGASYCYSSQRNFLPKTTFTYEEAVSDCPKPSNFVASDVTAHTAVLSWESEGFAFLLQYKKASDSNWTQRWLDFDENPYTLTGLSGETEYQARVAAFHETCPTDPETGDNIASDWREISFTTAVSCPKPTNLTCSAYTATTATFTWTNGGDETQWVLEYATSDDFSGATSVNIVQNDLASGAYTLTGLTAEQTYYARIKTDCGGGDQSAWSNTSQFKPSAAQIVTIGSGSGVSSYVPAHPNWNYSYTQQIYTAAEIGVSGAITSISFKGNKNGTRSLVVYMANTSKEAFASTSDYIPIAEATQVFSGNVTFAANEWITIELEGDGFDYDGSNLAVIVDDNSGNYNMGSTNWAAFTTTNYEAMFFYQDSGNPANIDPASPNASNKNITQTKNQIILNVLPTTTPKPRSLEVSNLTAYEATISWTAPAENVLRYYYQYGLTGGAMSEWVYTNETSVNLTELTPSTDYTFNVYAEYAEGNSDIASKDFTTEATCLVPSGLAINNMVATWEAGTATQWNLQYRKSGTEEWTAINGLTAATYDLSTLTLDPTTTYDVQVQADCGNDDLSVWSESVNFTTPCASYDIPYTYGFEDAAPFVCWTVISGNITRYQGSPHTGSYRLDFRGTTSNMIALPQFNEATNNLRVEFWTRPESTGGSSGKFAIGYMTDITDASTFVAVETYISTAMTTTYVKKTVDFVGVPANANIAMRQFDCSTNYYWYVDDVTVKEIPPCLEPTGLAVSNVDAHTATLSWTSDATAWQIGYYKTVEGIESEQYLDVTENPFTLTGLDPETAYTVRMRTDCNAANDGYSEYTDPVSFTTDVACPAPTGLTATEISAYTAKLNWTGTSESYIVSYRTAARAGEWQSVYDVVEVPFILTGLVPETTYEAKVQGYCGEEGLSVETNIISFTTLESCPTPTGLAAANVTTTTADLSWNGSVDVESYTVQYREVIVPPVEVNDTYDFEDNTLQGWTTISNDNDAYAWAVQFGSSYAHASNYCVRARYVSSSTGGDANDWLISPQIQLGGTFSFYAKKSSSGIDRFQVYVSTTGNDISDFTAISEVITPNSTYDKYEYDLSGYSGNGYVAIVYTAPNDQYYLYVDDITFTDHTDGEYGDWITYNDNVTSTTVTMEGLNSGTMYDVRVKANCSDPEAWSNMVTFTILKEYVWVNNDDEEVWDELNGGTEPTEATDLELPANAILIIPDGVVAYVNNITLGENSQIIIQDGGQLHHSNEVPVALQMGVLGWGAKDEEVIPEWHLITAPVTPSVSIASTRLVSEGNFDLYSFEQSYDPEEWFNYKAEDYDATGITQYSELLFKKGYLYSNTQNVFAVFAGQTIPTNENVLMPLDYDANARFAGWNLVGNPFTCLAYVDHPFYTLNGEGTEIISTTSTSVEVTEAIFVVAMTENENDTVVTFSTSEFSEKSASLVLNLSSGSNLIDRAIVRFDEGRQLPKFQLDPNHTKVYITMDNEDYAIVRSEGVGELPVSFKAENNGSYSMSFTTEEVSFNYLHLIDNMTGKDVDLLVNPSYTFEASTTDYASRFKLVFATGDNSNDDNFAFYSNGNFVINNEGEATLQVVDVMGRIIKSETINGSASVSVTAATGVYMLRLINGNDVKVQKVVVR